MTIPLVVSWGGGVNSTAMLIGMRERNIFPDLILFADTGGEKPATYEFSENFDNWLKGKGFPGITVVRNDGLYVTLENECLQTHSLPSIAYGFKSCSDKYKRRPQIKYLKSIYGSNLCNVTVAIGIDAGESHRAVIGNNPYKTIFPLIEWGWDRDKCIEAIKGVDLFVPMKSACFFCPSSRKHEIEFVAKKYPELFKRAVDMEHNAELTTIKGLGRNYSWEQLIADKTLRAYEQPRLPCMCFDGDDED